MFSFLWGNSLFINAANHIFCYSLVHNYFHDSWIGLTLQALYNLWAVDFGIELMQR